MKLNQLKKGADIIVQIVMGKNNIEFHLEIVESDEDAVYTLPYLRNYRPLELNINANPNVVCNIFGEDSFSKKRISWKNVRLETVRHNGHVMYKFSTMLFNRDSQSGERRDHERMLDEIAGVIEDYNGEFQDVNIHDISDNGIAFYADSKISINHDRFTLRFEDSVGNENFNFKLTCKIVRFKDDGKNTFYGCEVLEPPHDYLLYTFMFRLKNTER